MSGNITVDTKGLTEPITKLIEVCSRGVGKLYEPTHIKKMARAKAEEIRLISEAIIENIEMPSEYSNGKVSLDGSSIDELSLRMQRRVRFQELKRQSNIDNIVSEAHSQLLSEEAISSEELDDDWITRFFNYAGDISNEEMQILWGAILSGEVKRPGTFSLRTLEIVRCITKLEANLFKRICCYLIPLGEYHSLYNDEAVHNEYKIDFLDIVKLSDIGLFHQKDLSVNFEMDGSATKLLSKEDGVAIRIRNKTDSKKICNLRLYKLTDAGEELFSITEKKLDLGFIKSISKALEIQQFQLGINTVIAKDETRYIYKMPTDWL